jgi:hypothetical protein
MVDTPISKHKNQNIYEFVIYLLLKHITYLLNKSSCMTIHLVQINSLYFYYIKEFFFQLLGAHMNQTNLQLKIDLPT